MILTGAKIIEEVKVGNITIIPFNRENINPNSYNYHLGESYIEFPADQFFDCEKRNIKIKKQKLIKRRKLLKPGRLYLFNTKEEIGSLNYVTSLIGRSSMGRLGIFLQISANLGHQGEIHKWTLEIRVCHPIFIYPGMTIGQVTFWQPEGIPLLSNGHYKKYNLPHL